MSFRRRTLLSCFAIYLFSQAFFLIYIQFPEKLNFDEFHYVPAARQMIAHGRNANMQHPPLAKVLIAEGIRIGGDRPFGWRVMSTIAGAATAVAVYLCGLALFRSQSAALFSTALALVNQFLYVQARIAMLDTFMEAFLMWALAAIFSSLDEKLDPRSVRRLWIAFGVFEGLAVACKWTAAVALFPTWAIILAFGFLRRRDTGPAFGAFALVALPILVYLLCFFPLFGLSEFHYRWYQLLGYHAAMWKWQTSWMKPHLYGSQWFQWPLIVRPIWYAFSRSTLEGRDMIRGVVLLGNPLVMWSGFVAVLLCVWAGVVRRSRPAFLISIFYLTFTFVWILVPRQVSFYYYYYPAAMFLGFALTLLLFEFEEFGLFFTLSSVFVLVRLVFSATVRMDASGFAWQVWGVFWISLVTHLVSKGRASRIPAAKWIFLASAITIFVFYFPILSGMQIVRGAYLARMWFLAWM